MAKQPSQSGMKPLGAGGMMWSLDGSFLYVAIPVDQVAHNRAQPSQSGKTRVIATTSGFASFPGTDVKLSLNATIPAAGGTVAG